MTKPTISAEQRAMLETPAGRPHYMNIGRRPHSQPITFDPLSKYEGHTLGNLMDMLGILPLWLIEGLKNDESAQHAIVSRYDFGNPEMKGGVINEAGVYQYPQDEPLHPIATVTTQHTTVLFYPYAMVGFVDNKSGGSLMYRMD